MTILIVDDEKDIRDIARLALTFEWDVSVLEAASGEEGVQIATQRHPDAILMDVLMPKMDGPAALRKLQENPDTAGIPVIFLTGRNQQSDIDQLRKIGAAGVIKKPFDPTTLAGDIQAVLNRK